MKLSDLDDQAWLARLGERRMRDLSRQADWWSYYYGNQPLYFIAKILQEQEDRFPPLVINWCQKFVDWIDARCQVEGFRIGGEPAGDEDLWDIWQHNNLDEEQSENNVSSLVTGAGYVLVAPDDDGRALITVEPPESVAVEMDPRTRKVLAAIKTWRSEESLTSSETLLDDMAEIWLPDRIVTFQGEEKVAERKQKAGAVGAFPFWNRRQRLRGHSELQTLKPIVDAANQVATNMMAGVEHHAVPRKWALNIAERDFTDQDGNPIPAWKIATGALWAQPFDEDNPDVKPEVGQFAQSDLRNFHETIMLLGRIGAGLCDIAPHEFGFGVADNPASADGIEAAKESGVRRVERILTARGGAWEAVMRHAAVIEGKDPKTLDRLETIWRDPSTPTKAAKVAAAAQALSTGIIDRRQAREDAGYSDTQIRNMEEREKADRQQVDPVTQALIDELNTSGNRNAGAAPAAAPVGG